ncbi:hypothetical protein Tco_0692026 [Tanacetum coccineum]
MPLSSFIAKLDLVEFSISNKAYTSNINRVAILDSWNLQAYSTATMPDASSSCWDLTDEAVSQWKCHLVLAGIGTLEAMRTEQGKSFNVNVVEALQRPNGGDVRILKQSLRYCAFRFWC